MDKVNKKIQQYKNSDLFIVFYNDWCSFSKRALELLERKKISFKAYDIDNIGGIDKVLTYLKKEKDLTNFDVNHKTRPIIFYKGKFIGGYSELSSFIEKHFSD